MPRANSTIASCADFSTDEEYRYALTRIVRGEQCGKLLFVLLNPSCADAILNDKTVMNCQNIAFRADGNQNDQFGPFSAFRVCNLFARVGAVANLKKLALEDRISEPRCPGRNNRTIRTACDWADDILCGWGGELMCAGQRREITCIVKASGKPLWCLGVGSNGDPRHPSRGQENNPIRPFNP